jgi:hypothetical protein
VSVQLFDLSRQFRFRVIHANRVDASQSYATIWVSFLEALCFLVGSQPIVKYHNCLGMECGEVCIAFLEENGLGVRDIPV